MPGSRQTGLADPRMRHQNRAQSPMLVPAFGPRNQEAAELESRAVPALGLARKRQVGRNNLQIKFV